MCVKMFGTYQALNNNSKYLYVIIYHILANANLFNPYNNPNIQLLL